MNESEQQFEALRRLLALKRHEMPPPGYFNNFSSQVRTRIVSGETHAPNMVDELFDQAPWLARVFRVLEMKPAFAVTFAFALCLILVFGIVYAERQEADSKPPLESLATATSPLIAVAPGTLAQAASDSGIVSSTNPVLSLQPVASSLPFGQSPFGAQTVGYQLP